MSEPHDPDQQSHWAARPAGIPGYMGDQSRPFDPNEQYLEPVDGAPYYPIQHGAQPYAQQPYAQRPYGETIGQQAFPPAYTADPYGQQPYPPPYGQQPYGPPYGHQIYGSPYGQPYPSPSHGLSVAALVTGILGFILSWFPLVGIALAVLAIIFGAIGLQRNRTEGRGLALAGLVLGVLGAVLFIAFATAWW